MELPKNITQIGEVSRDCKIYVEDYVISYMKQLNQVARDKEVAVALYGVRKEENGISYHFMYGACKLNYLQREVRHLSQAQRQEIEKLRRKYFPEQDFLGYRILDGEMIEGLHVCEQEICRYIGGYARFYEKNDAMLAYMLDVRDQAEPEYVDRTKYDEVRKRQEERRVAAGYSTKTVEQSVPKQERNAEIAETVLINKNLSASASLQRMKLAAVGCFALLCLVGIGTFREDELAENQVDSQDVVAASGSVEQTDTLVMEDKLEEALLEENQTTQEQTEDTAVETIPEAKSEVVPEAKSEAVPETQMPSETVAETAEQTESLETATQTSQAVSEAVAYVVQPGDTLITICLRQYGSDVRVADVSALNEIDDPDDIKEGQVIMLPR